MLCNLVSLSTAGSVTIGAYDDFNAIANLAEKHNIWFHVDAAFASMDRALAIS